MASCSKIEENLPSKFFYIITDQTFVTPEKFSCILRIQLNSENEFKEWLKDFQETTRTSWNLRNSKCSGETSRFILSRDYVCHHSSYRKKTDVSSKSNKNKHCLATLKIRIKKDTQWTRRVDPFMKRNFNAVIDINFNHTHQINVAEAWKWLKRSEDTKETFLEYFNSGLSPAAARMFHEDLLLTEGPEQLANSQRNPPKKWIYDLNQKWIQTNYGNMRNQVDFISKIKAKIESLKENNCKIMFEEEPFCLVIVTPLMQRQLSALESFTSIFIDSSASCDSTNVCLTLALVGTKAGAVPVGAFIHHSQNQQSYMRGFTFLEKLWTEVKLPTIENFMTDDSYAMRNALRCVFPSIPLLLCHFHVLQAIWRWLFNGKNNIRQEDRQPLFVLFKNILYSSDEEGFNKNVKLLQDNNVANKYPNFLEYISNYLLRKSEWCLLYRLHIRNMKNNTNNYSEASFRILKDIILSRVKAYNPVALLEYITMMDKYYSKRLLDLVYNREKKLFHLFEKYANKAEKIKNSCLITEYQNFFLVQSENDKSIFYEVDVGLCTCVSAIQGAFCKHQCAVMLKYNISFPNAPILSAKENEILYTIATGLVAGNFLGSMMQPENSDDNQSISSSINESNIIANSQSAISETSDEKQFCIEKKRIQDESIAIKAEFSLEMSRIERLLEENLTDENLMQQTKKFVEKCKKKQSAMELANFFANVSSYKVRNFKKIRVQPTSISRRIHSKSRSNLRQKSGRPCSVKFRKKIKNSLNSNHSINKNHF